MIPLLPQHPLVSLLTKYHIIYIFLLNIAKKEGGGAREYIKTVYKNIFLELGILFQLKILRVSLRGLFLKSHKMFSLGDYKLTHLVPPGLNIISLSYNY